MGKADRETGKNILICLDENGEFISCESTFTLDFDLHIAKCKQEQDGSLTIVEMMSVPENYCYVKDLHNKPDLLKTEQDVMNKGAIAVNMSGNEIIGVYSQSANLQVNYFHFQEYKTGQEIANTLKKEGWHEIWPLPDHEKNPVNFK